MNKKILDVHGRELPEPFDCPICFRPAVWNISVDGNLVRCPEGSCKFHGDGMRAGFFFEYWQRLAARSHERKMIMLKLVGTLENWAEVSEVSRQTGLAAARLARYQMGSDK
jgi:hypothetical protein